MITVRPYAMADAATCADILTLAGRAAFGASAWPVHDVAAFLSVTQDETILVAERDGVVIGFAAVYAGQAPDNFLHHLYVHPAASGQGAGTLLLAAVVAQFGPRLSLKVQVSNTRARRFYACAGWVEDSHDTGTDQIGRWIRMHCWYCDKSSHSRCRDNV
ncbi:MULTISPECIES: GNAT family N-acetyltransferase [unclassified Janthinobacterium]|uniref:GNAT family N-acetyltransferase n=1 Tax=unclassified Janthinobacterium TaxID=2610881 RepID=UPI001615E7B2|nr:MULTISPECIES: GNAT family N-acetyltransferase [unclassified Janthinobacterium]MBB5371375.1 ribosomal protein S18 acetylase RimI-like enzyme [Janthinobacterium sp. K2C7]MBB5384181.1 ribosomal protein S18 acetylase RimI-like enzyme [Janthinobacterium sp. K2Li3]MBB5389359.1 ribosomal protein S18 acetylase RimI-like enzyme [Janthinobacterium sp. K2E3]